MENLALEVSNLVKTYGEVSAVNDISFTVKRGTLFAFLGINGAGKSTTINIICSILKKNSGKVIVNGFDLDQDIFKIKNEIGIVFQNSVLDQELTVKENLEIRTSFYSLSREEKKKNIASIISLLELEPILNQSIKSLSGGQKRRVDIARAMVHNPKLLILDEPTTGLDPKTRLIVWSLIDKIRKETNMTVFLTTHYLEEAEKATDVVIMDKGKIIARGTPHELKNLYSSDYIYSYMAKNESFENELNLKKISYEYIEDKLAYRIKIKNSQEAKNVLFEFKDYILDFEILKGNMDDVFLNVTGKNIIVGEEDANK